MDRPGRFAERIMASPRGKERREPVFDVSPSSTAPVSGGPDIAAPRRPPERGDRPKRKRRRRKARGGIGRVVYWGAVASLWIVIALIGGAVWVGAHLPPIQSLEIPKRPPSIKIADMHGRP